MKKVNTNVKMFLSEIGRRGGKKSRRKLSSIAAKKMVQLREARRAFKKFHAKCFWSFDPNYKIEMKDISWVANQLMKNGDRKTWELGVKLCR